MFLWHESTVEEDVADTSQDGSKGGSRLHFEPEDDIVLLKWVTNHKLWTCKYGETEHIWKEVLKGFQTMSSLLASCTTLKRRFRLLQEKGIAVMKKYASEEEKASAKQFVSSSNN